MSYIPRPDSEFDAFFSNLLNYATPKIAASPSVWPHIDLINTHGGAPGGGYGNENTGSK